MNLDGLTWSGYGGFGHGGLDASNWAVRKAAGPDGAVLRREDPATEWTLDDTGMRARIARFTAHHDTDQGADNAKLVVLSTRRVPIPAGGRIAVSADLAVRKLGGDAGDLADGALSFTVIDPASFTVNGILCSGAKVAAFEEKAPFGAPGTYCRSIESPLSTPPVTPGNWVTAAVAFDAGDRSLHWFADGVEIFARHGLADIPAELMIGLAIVTMRPLRPEGSVSNRGQGLDVRCRGVRIGTGA